MRFFATILVFISFVTHSQSWAQLKSKLKSESDKNKLAIQNARSSWPKDFSDGSNHFLMTQINPSGMPIYLTTLNANAAITTGAVKLQNGSTGFLLNGNGQHIFQWDAGAVLSHVEFDNRVVANEGNTTDRHATHIAGTLIASGVNAQAKGMATQAQVHAYYFDDDILEIATQSEANQYGFMISNHSYGSTTGWHRINSQWQWFGDESISLEEDYKAGFYTAKAKQLDEIAFLSPYHTMVWAAGNDRADAGNGSHPSDCNGGAGYDCIIQQGTAKNVITVGGVDQVLNYTGPASVPMPGFSSWGPTDDGRIKPDLVSDGASVFSTTNTGVDQYTTLGGTSMATATVSGSLLLLQELHGKLNGGRWMRASTLKGLAIHTTKETGTSLGPDYNFGWGLLDVDAAARVLSRRDDINTFIIEGELLNDDMHEWILNPQANQKITATLVWTDPAGLPPNPALDPPYKMLVNDLDLRLSDANGTTQYPWNLDPGNPSGAATHGDNTRDNVEKIEFNFPDLKPYTLTLSHKDYLLNDSQHYSLIITYSSTNTTKTLYWVGGSGNWNDAIHWSLNSGGSAAGVVPAVNDNVIVDENSFSETGAIQLTSNENCQSMLWYCSKEAGVNFNNHTLTVSKELILASGAFKKSGNGKFLLNTSTVGSLNATIDFTARPNIDFISGNWKVNGNLFIDSLDILGGSVLLSGYQITLNHFRGSSNANLEVDRGTLTVQKSWVSDVSKLNITSSNATLISDGNSVTIEAPNLIWSGTMVNTGDLSIAGDITVDSLSLASKSILKIGNSNTLSVNNGLTMLGELGAIASITSIETASLRANFHRKICTDFVSVSNINLIGDAVINVGANSLLQNASGWLKQSCDDVLFPDFTFRYACAAAFTEFTSTSSGNITSFQWNFGDSNSDVNESDAENPLHQFSDPGSYTVTLAISDGIISRLYSREIEFAANTLPKTTIEHNNEVLFSSIEASQYQWYNNSLILPGETKRMYAYSGAEGLYQVALFDEQCNRPSDVFSISGIEETKELFQVYPNPTNERLYFTIPDIEQVTVKNVVGRSVNVTWNPSERWVDLSATSSGMYLLILQRQGKTFTKKVWVQK